MNWINHGWLGYTASTEAGEYRIEYDWDGNSLNGVWLLLPNRWRDADWQVGVAHPGCNRAAGAQPMSAWQSISFRWKLKLIAAFFLFVSLCVTILYVTAGP